MSSSLIVVALMALGNILPQQRQIIQEVTGLSPIALGIMPVLLFMGAAFCQSGAELTSAHQFPVSGVTLDAPEGLQLFVVAALLGVFAAAVRGAEDDQVKKEKKTVELVRADRIAMRLACAAALFGLYQMTTVWSWSGFTQTTEAVKWFPASPPDGFANSQAVVEVPEGIQLLTISALLYVFKTVVESADEKDQQISSQVQLVSANRIALRFSVAAALLGFAKCVSSFKHLLPTTPVEDFGKSDITMEVPEGVQLLIVSVLLLVFMKAISEDEDVQKNSKDDKQLVQLIRADAIAFRLSIAASTLGLFKIASESGAVTHAVSLWTTFSQMIPTSPVDGFGKSEATLEVSQGVQLLIVSLLLFVFKMAISEADHEPGKSNAQPQVELVRPDAIAFRFALASGTFGLVKIMSESGVMGAASTSSLWANCVEVLPASSLQEFGKSETTLDVSEGMMWLIVAALIFTFRMAISDTDVKQQESKQKKEKKHVELVSAPAIATRFAVSAMIIGSLKMAFGSNSSMSMSPWIGLSHTKQATIAALMNLKQIFHASPGFADSDIVMDVPEGFQLLLVSALILVFKLAIDSDHEQEQSSEVSEKPKVQLVNPSRIALRLATAGGVVGLGKLAAPAMTHSVNALMSSGELLAKGGMLGASTALVLWNAHKQSQNMKA